VFTARYGLGLSIQQSALGLYRVNIYIYIYTYSLHGAESFLRS